MGFTAPWFGVVHFENSDTVVFVVRDCSFNGVTYLLGLYLLATLPFCDGFEHVMAYLAHGNPFVDPSIDFWCVEP